MNIQEVIKQKLKPYGLDGNEKLVEAIQSAVEPLVEAKLERLISRRLIKRAVSQVIDNPPVIAVQELDI